MKKRRRIEVVIERRELSLFGISPADAGGGAASLGASGSEEDKPACCATCGSTEMLRMSDAMILVALDPVGPGAERSNVHCMFSASEEWWVCKPSLHLGQRDF